MSYGKSLSLDLHDCDPALFNRRDLKKFVRDLCTCIDMTPAKLVFWDYRYSPFAKRSAPPHLKGTSLVQFIETSTITIHTLDDLRAVYIDLFSCKDFNAAVVITFARAWFGGQWVVNSSITERI